MDKLDGPFSPISLVFFNFFITPAIGRMPGPIVFGLCVLAYSRTYGRTSTEMEYRLTWLSYWYTDRYSAQKIMDWYSNC